MHSLGSAGSFECRVSGFVLHGRRSQHSLQRKHVCVVEFQISRWHWVASKHQGPFLGESRPCASLPAPAPTCSSSPWYPPKRRLSSSALQTFSRALTIQPKTGKNAVPEAREPAREADTGSSFMLHPITSETHGEEGSPWFNKLCPVCGCNAPLTPGPA